MARIRFALDGKLWIFRKGNLAKRTDLWRSEKYNFSEFPSKGNGQLVYELAERGRANVLYWTAAFLAICQPLNTRRRRQPGMSTKEKVIWKYKYNVKRAPGKYRRAEKGGSVEVTTAIVSGKCSK